MTLKTLTGASCGIVLYADYTAVICLFDKAGDDQLPDMQGDQLLFRSRPGIYDHVQEEYNDQLKVYLLNMDPQVLYDENGMYRQLFTNRQPQPGKIFRLPEAGIEVCIPDFWWE